MRLFVVGEGDGELLRHVGDEGVGGVHGVARVVHEPVLHLLPAGAEPFLALRGEELRDVVSSLWAFRPVVRAGVPAAASKGSSSASLLGVAVQNAGRQSRRPWVSVPASRSGCKWARCEPVSATAGFRRAR